MHTHISQVSYTILITVRQRATVIKNTLIPVLVDRQGTAFVEGANHQQQAIRPLNNPLLIHDAAASQSVVRLS